jgi:hypothetical protein
MAVFTPIPVDYMDNKNRMFASVCLIYGRAHGTTIMHVALNDGSIN